jgi:hypothetical protein
MAVVSFAKTPGAGVSAPVTPPPAPAEKAPEANAQVTDAPAPETTTTDTRVATQEHAPTNALGFYTSEDDAPETDPRDIRLPRLNLIQGLTKPELKAIVPAGIQPDGEFVYKQAVHLPRPFRAVVVGVKPKIYVEKLPKFGEGEARIAKTLQEVAAFGGTSEWRESRENKDKDGVPVSRKPWFPAHVTLFLLIQRPEGADDANFPAVTPSGLAFGPALFTVKSTSFGSFYIPLNTELRGLFRGSFHNRFIEVSSDITKNKSFVPTVRIKEETSAEVRELAVRALS